jgi:putative membrane protein
MKNQINMKQFGVIGALGLAFICLPGAMFGQGNEENGHGEATRIPQYHKTSATSSPVQTQVAPHGTGLTAQDSNFVSKAAQGGMMEVEMGKSASKKAQSPDVKSFGQRMVTDHTKANNQLNAIVKTHGISLPKASGMKKWPGDKEYMAMMVSDHEQDLAEFKDEAKKGNDPQLKAFASQTAKIIADHLKMAKQIHSKM